MRLADKKECTGCMVCVDICKHSAILSKMDSDGHYYPYIDESKCVGCGLCTKTCPVTNGFCYAQESDYRPLVAWCKDDEVRLNSSSGGVFAATAIRILNNNGIVVGCKMDDLRARHVIIEDIKDLRSLQGSKYLHSDASSVYRDIKIKLMGGKQVLFSGTRCQVAGLLSFLGKSYNNLYTIDLVCTGVPSYNLVKFYKGKYSAVASFRDKKNGWKDGYHLTLTDNKGENIRDAADARLLAKGFQNGLTTRYSCYDCKFAHLHSKADLTLMDFWGDKDYPEEHFKGLSCVVPNSQKGIDLLQESNVQMNESEWKKCLPYNPRLVYGKSLGMQSNIIRRIMPYAFEHFSQKTLLALYASQLSMHNPLHILVKIYKYLKWRTMTADKKKFINNVIKDLDK